MSKPQILIVEDEGIVAIDLQERVIKMGFEAPRISHTADDAIVQATSFRPNLVLMDIRLNGTMDGIVAAETIRSSLGIPVVFLTAFADENTLRRAKASEPYGYLMKPCGETELRMTIDIALQNHASTKRIASTLHSVADGVICVDTDGTVLSMNPAAESLTGWSEAQAEHSAIGDVLEVDKEVVSRLTAKAADGRSPGGLYSLALRRSNDTAPVPTEVHVGLLRSHNEEPHGSVIVIRELKHRLSADSKLLQAENRAKILLEALPDAIFRLNRSGEVMDAHLPGAGTTRGGDLVGSNLYSSHLPRLVVDQILTALRLSLEKCEVSTLKFVLPSPTGAQRMFSLVSAAGEMLYASASSTQVFGYIPEELLGRNTFELFHPNDRENSRRALKEVLSGPPASRQLQARVREKSGQWRRVESRIFSLNEPEVAAVVVNCLEFRAAGPENEPDQESFEEQIRASTEHEHFAHAVAHDLQEPLRIIWMFTELLVQQPPLDEHVKQLAELILQGITRISTLFEGLQAYALRSYVDLPRRVELGHVVAKVLQDLRFTITTSDARVTVDPLPNVQSNEKHLLRVFRNLIANAIKYHAETPVEIHVTAERKDSDWVIKIKDNGIGIAPEHHESIFLLMRRLHGTEVPGAGMGLAICKKIIEELGGAIWVESEPGVGSNFCFTIAAASEERAVSAGDQYMSSLPKTTSPHQNAPWRRPKDLITAV